MLYVEDSAKTLEQKSGL